MKFIFIAFIGLMFINPINASEQVIKEKDETGSAGVGLQGIADWSTQFPFLDQMKLAREWLADWRENSKAGMVLDKNGWILSVEPNVTPSTVFLTGHEGLPIIYSHYIVQWEGKGRLKYDWCARKVGEAKGGDRIHVHCTDSSLLTIIETDSEDPIRNITIVPEKHYNLFVDGEIFNPDFIERIQGFRALRYMDWLKTNGSKQQIWSDRPLPQDRTYAEKGVPIEVIISLSNKVLADPWLNIPHQVDLNYIRKFAELTKSLIKPELSVYVEHSNEVWNWVFPQTHFAQKAGKELFDSDAGDLFLQWHGVRTAQMCSIWKKEVFINDADSVVCVLGAQASWPESEAAALDCPFWQKKGNPACIDYGIDAIAITGYFSGCLNGGENEVNQRKIIGWGRYKDKGLQKAYEQVVDGRHFKCEDSLPDVNKYYKYFAKESKKRGLSLLAYEGGQHITSNMGNTQNDKRFSDLHIMLNRSPYMKKLYQLNFENWMRSGGGLFMHFVDTSSYSKYGSWGALEYITQETSPKWEALSEFNNTPCWWENCKK